MTLNATDAELKNDKEATFEKEGSNEARVEGLELKLPVGGSGDWLPNEVGLLVP